MWYFGTSDGSRLIIKGLMNLVPQDEESRAAAYRRLQAAQQAAAEADRKRRELKAAAEKDENLKKQLLEAKKKAETAALSRKVGETTTDPELGALLNKLGACTSGFTWVREPGGYKCAAGGHHVTDAQVSGMLNLNLFLFCTFVFQCLQESFLFIFV